RFRSRSSVRTCACALATAIRLADEELQSASKLEGLDQTPSQAGVVLPAGDEIRHHRPDAGAAAQRLDQQPREPRPKERRLEPCGARELRSDLIAHAARISRCCVSGGRGFGGPFTRSEREVDALARDWIDEARGVTYEIPAISGDRQCTEIIRG